MEPKDITTQRIGQYKISGLIGEGGMGVVYRGRDERLGRKVALKLLTKGVASDDQSRKRFLREARTASQLNHPNICTIYDTGELDGQPYLVMELLEGRNLRERMEARPPEISEVIEIAIQICDALDAAHFKGIVHRDIKPANVFITRLGAVKILDFGLAKPVPEPDASTAPLTVPGMVLGTTVYMSPEQIQGAAVDGRSDLFSLGVLLYEMCTGGLPFQGSNEVATLDAILTKQPVPADRLKPSLPPELPAIIDRCLEKDRERRYQTAAQLRTDLKQLWRKLNPEKSRLSHSMPAVEAFPKPRRKMPGWLIPGLALGLPLVLIAGWYLWSRFYGASLGPVLQRATFTQITDQGGEKFFPSLSADGKNLVYAAKTTGKWRIFAQRAGRANAFNLSTGSQWDDTEPALSPDGETIAFRSERDGGGIFVMGATGEQVRKLANRGYNPAWSPDGAEIVYATQEVWRPEMRGPSVSELWRVRIKDGNNRMIFRGDACQPSWSPHGSRIAYWEFSNDRPERHLWTIAPDAAQPEKTVVQSTFGSAVDWNPVWSPDGKYLYFSSDRGGSMNLWRVRIDERTGRTSSEPEPLTTPSTYSGQMSFSRDGQRLAYVQHRVLVNLYSLDFDPAAGKILGTPVELTHGQRKDRYPDVSPDGRTIVFRGEIGKQEDLFLFTLGEEGVRQVTSDASEDRTPRWSPDGKRIAFYSNRSGRDEIWTVRPDGGGLTQLTNVDGRGVLFPIWSPDGSRIAASQFEKPALLIDSNKGSREQTPTYLPPLGTDSHWFAVTAWLSDNTLLGYEAKPEGGSAGILLYNIGSGQFRRLTDSGMFPVPLPDGRRAIYTSNFQILIVDLRTGQTRETANLEPYALGGRIALTPDGRKLYASLGTTDSDVWIAQFGGQK